MLVRESGRYIWSMESEESPDPEVAACELRSGTSVARVVSAVGRLMKYQSWPNGLLDEREQEEVRTAHADILEVTESEPYPVVLATDAPEFCRIIDHAEDFLAQCQ